MAAQLDPRQIMKQTKMSFPRPIWPWLICCVALAMPNVGQAALLAYEPFTNASGTAVIGAASGVGFNGSWQSNGSSGTATNTSYGLGYSDAASNTLATVGGAGFFQGLTTANSSMQPIRLFNFSRGTNGADGTSTWISFLIARQGPTGTLAGNLYGRGANVPHDLNTGALQKLAIGNGSGAASNTVALIPQGSGASIKGATNQFGGVTNFVVVRIDHLADGNDNAYLFVNPPLTGEPAIASAGAASLGQFDYSFDRLRVFAGGQSSAAQPYAELVLDEYRIGESFADVAPIVSNAPPVVVGPLRITNTFLVPGGVVVAGNGGSNGASYLVLAATNLTTPLTNWMPVATNQFDAAGNFSATNPTTPGLPQQFFRLRSGSLPLPPPVAPTITTQPTNQIASSGQNVLFVAAAAGSAPLHYQWRFNTTPLSAATNAVLTLLDVQFADQGGYSLLVTNAAGSATSAVVTLTVQAPPTIVAAPTNLTVTAGNNASFLVTASGSPPLRYQWYFQHQHRPGERDQLHLSRLRRAAWQCWDLLGGGDKWFWGGDQFGRLAHGECRAGAVAGRVFRCADWE